MKLILAPPDGPREEWKLDLNRLTVGELGAIQRVTGLPGLNAFGQAINDASGPALQALVWVMRKRGNPPLLFDNVDFAIADLSIEDDATPKEEDSEEESPNDAGG